MAADARDAAALANVIAEIAERDAPVEHDTVSSVSRLNELGWAAFAELAEVNIPTLATRSSVLVLLRKRITLAQAESTPGLRVVQP